jgi:hypothetical protein
MKSGTVRKTKSTKTLGPTFINDAVTEASKTAEVLKEIKPENFIDTDFQGRREIARRCFTREDLHYHASNAIDRCDARIVKDLRAAVAAKVTLSLNEECLRARLLPAEMINYLDYTHLLLHTILPARAAERITGVPASILIAEYKHFFGFFEEEPEIENDFFDAGLRFASPEASFLEHAVRLATDKAFEPVWTAAHDPAECLKELRRCEVWDDDTRLNMVGSIASYHLQKLDLHQTARTLARLSA